MAWRISFLVETRHAHRAFLSPHVRQKIVATHLHDPLSRLAMQQAANCDRGRGSEWVAAPAAHVCDRASRAGLMYESALNTVGQIEAAIVNLDPGERARLAEALPRVIPELDGDARWAEIID